MLTPVSRSAKRLAGPRKLTRSIAKFSETRICEPCFSSTGTKYKTVFNFLSKSPMTHPEYEQSPATIVQSAWRFAIRYAVLSVKDLQQHVWEGSGAMVRYAYEPPDDTVKIVSDLSWWAARVDIFMNNMNENRPGWDE